MDTHHKRVTLITGATSGIGLALARLFAKDNHHLFLVARDEKKLSELQNAFEREFGIAVGIAVGDLTDAVFRASFPSAVHTQGLVVECLVNNAGSGVKGEFRDTDWEKEENSFLLNALVPTHLSKIFLADLIETKGSILNVASTAAFLPGPHMAVYYASKAYLLSLSESLRMELEASSVRVTALLPGPTITGFQAANGMPVLSGTRYPQAKEVAEFGYRAWQKNKAIAIYGLRNKLVYILAKLLPRSVTRILIHLSSR